MTRERTEADLIALKRAGVNAVRTSHYPNNSFFYELCDELGLYVVDEANMESHGIWDVIVRGGADIADAVPGDRLEWRGAVLDRARSMYERDKNHPCVLMWSCGNESFGGTNILAMAELLRSLDARPVHYEGVTQDARHPRTTDVVSRMYTPAARVEELLASQRSKPFILCEYAHAMGNSLGAVDEYLDLAEREPLFQGGFIWDFADQVIALRAPDGTPYWGYGGDCGEAPHDGDFCGNGLFYADHAPSPKVQELRPLYRGLRTAAERESFTMTNRHLFTLSAVYECVVVLEREGVELARGRVDTDVPPGGRGLLPAVALPAEPGEYAVTISFRLREHCRWAEAGFEVAGDQGVFVVGAPTPRAFALAGVASRPELVMGRHNVGVRGESFEVLFSRLAGGLSSYRYGRTPDGARELLRAPVRPCFWHAPTANERGYGGPFEEGAWHLASRYQRAAGGWDSPRVERDGEGVTVGFVYELAGLPGSTCAMDYRVRGGGTVEVAEALEPAGEVPSLPELSALIEVPGALDRLRFYGEGPAECYADRRRGARLGVYEGAVADQMAGYLVPQESGSHTGCGGRR